EVDDLALSIHACRPSSARPCAAWVKSPPGGRHDDQRFGVGAATVKGRPRGRTSRRLPPMTQFQRLLVIVDPRMRHSPALQRAAALARAGGATLHVAALVATPALVALLPAEVQARTRDGYAAECRTRLEEQIEPLRRQGLTITREVLCVSDLRAEILQHVAELQPDLLIKDVQHEGELKRTFITPLDWHL